MVNETSKKKTYQKKKKEKEKRKEEALQISKSKGFKDCKLKSRNLKSITVFKRRYKTSERNK